MTPPMVVLPLNKDLIDANLTVEQLQTFQHVGNVVEVQLQPISAPPPHSPRLLIHHFLTELVI